MILEQVADHQDLARPLGCGDRRFGVGGGGRERLLDEAVLARLGDPDRQRRVGGHRGGQHHGVELRVVQQVLQIAGRARGGERRGQLVAGLGRGVAQPRSARSPRSRRSSARGSAPSSRGRRRRSASACAPLAHRVPIAATQRSAAWPSPYSDGCSAGGCALQGGERRLGIEINERVPAGGDGLDPLGVRSQGDAGHPGKVRLLLDAPGIGQHRARAAEQGRELGIAQRLRHVHPLHLRQFIPQPHCLQACSRCAGVRGTQPGAAGPAVDPSAWSGARDRRRYPPGVP